MPLCNVDNVIMSLPYDISMPCLGEGWPMVGRSLKNQGISHPQMRNGILTPKRHISSTIYCERRGPTITSIHVYELFQYLVVVGHLSEVHYSILFYRNNQWIMESQRNVLKITKVVCTHIHKIGQPSRLPFFQPSQFSKRITSQTGQDQQSLFLPKGRTIVVNFPRKPVNYCNKIPLQYFQSICNKIPFAINIVIKSHFRISCLQRHHTCNWMAALGLVNKLLRLFSLG